MCFMCVCVCPGPGDERAPAVPLGRPVHLGLLPRVAGGGGGALPADDGRGGPPGGGAGRCEGGSEGGGGEHGAQVGKRAVCSGAGLGRVPVRRDSSPFESSPSPCGKSGDFLDFGLENGQNDSKMVKNSPTRASRARCCQSHSGRSVTTMLQTLTKIQVRGKAG